MNIKRVTSLFLLCFALATSVALGCNEEEIDSFEMMSTSILKTEVLPYSAETRCVAYFTKQTETKAVAEVVGMNSETSDKIISKIVLQEYKSSTNQYVNSGVPAQIETVYNSSYIRQLATFQITNAKQYRIKITIVSTKGGETKEIICYRNMS